MGTSWTCSEQLVKGLNKSFGIKIPNVARDTHMEELQFSYVQDNVYIKHHKQSLGTKTPFFGMFESAFSFTLQWVFKNFLFQEPYQ